MMNGAEEDEVEQQVIYPDGYYPDSSDSQSNSSSGDEKKEVGFFEPPLYLQRYNAVLQGDSKLLRNFKCLSIGPRH